MEVPLYNNKLYMEFVKHNKYLTKCQKKEFMNSKKNIFYVNNKSDKQISTYINYADKSKNLYGSMRIYILLNHFIKYDFVNSLINKIKEKKYTDTQIYKYIVSHPEIHEKRGNRLGVCSQYTYTFEKLALIMYSKYLSEENKLNITYLDVACGSGQKTKLFASKLELNDKNVYGTDIEEWGPYTNTEIKYPIQFKLLKNNKLDFADNEFNILSVFLALHHFPPTDLHALLKEFKRVLKPNGILAIIEHNILDDYDHLIVDIEHSINSYLYDKKPDDTYAYYFNYLELDFILTGHKFNWMYGYQMTSDVGFNVRYDNPFYALYMNIK